MGDLMLFTDGSVNTQSGIGYGAYLAVPESDKGLAADALDERVIVKRFADTSSTKLELQTLLWALNHVRGTTGRIIAYTDSQNIVGLTGRRVRLERNDYYSKNETRIRNHELYREFFVLTDSLEIEFVKVRGHQPAHEKDEIGELFTLVDRASRNALRASDLGQ